VTEVRRARDQAEVEAALELRHRVFCGEQGVSLAAEQDGLDAQALHVVAIEDGRLVGTCRLLFDDGIARLGRMAVEAGLRGRGMGATILAAAEREAREAGAQRLRLHAQSTARALYERGGYAPVGEVFMEEGIAHVTMEKPLA
jgi:predicted GNAT family N-acyltransferase